MGYYKMVAASIYYYSGNEYDSYLSVYNKLLTVVNLVRTNSTLRNKEEIGELTDGLWLGKVTSLTDIIAEIRQLVVKHGIADKPSVRRLDTKNLTEEEAEKFWPFRTKADRQIRRLWLTDLYNALNVNERKVINRINLDYVTTSNLIVYMKGVGQKIFTSVSQTGLFSNWDTFVIVSKEVNSLVKKLNTSLNVKELFAELNTLTGYQQLPFPGDNSTIPPFDEGKEIRELATGGNRHGLVGLDWDKEFETSLEEVSHDSYNERIEWISLEDYIRSAEWATSGSSSIGKVTWVYDKDTGKIKARKNMLTYIYSFEEIIELVKRWSGQGENKPVVKSELGKVRLAVASGLEGYILESWMMKLSGHRYKAWEGITLDETPSEDINRTLKESFLFKQGNYSLPFDYASFDHQVTLNEVKKILRYYYGHGLKVVPLNKKREYLNVLDKVIWSIGHSYLNGVVNGKVVRVQITGGLPSGVRSTSVIGNIWNSVMTNIARKIAARLVNTDVVKALALRGDDSLIVTSSYLRCYLIRLCYQAINAIGNNRKFGILHKEGEFLRTVITNDGRKGWFNRSIPSLTQRKPWNSEPWELGGQIKTITDNCDATIRRARATFIDTLKLGEYLEKAQNIWWEKRTKQSIRWLELPVRMGGFGLREWKGWLPDTKLRIYSPKTVSITNINNEVILSTNLSWHNLQASEAASYLNSGLNNLLRSDDVPGFAKKLNLKTFETFKKTKVSWRQVGLYSDYSTDSLEVPSGNYSNIRFPQLLRKHWVSKDGTIDLNQFLREYKQAEQAGLKLNSLNYYFENLFPGLIEEVQSWIQRGWSKTDAIELAQGNIPIEPTRYINSQLTSYVKETIGKELLHWRGKFKIARKLSQRTKQICKQLQNTRLSKYYDY